MSEITATRIVRSGWKVLAILALSTVWLGAASLLWRTSVPDGLDLPDLDPGQFFRQETLERHDRYERFLRALFVPVVLVQAAILVALTLGAPRLLRRLPFRPLAQGALLAFVAFICLWAARLPFGVTAHWWRRRYGVARQDYLEWLVDPWLELAAKAALTCGAVALGMVLAARLGLRWWVPAAPIVVVLAAGVALAQPLVLEPRVEPLRDPRLEADVRRLAQRTGVGSVDVVVRDASSRSRVANAEVYGIGPTRRVVLWDTLLDGRFSLGEIRTIVAHELGHVARDHVWKALGWVALLALPATFGLAQAARLRGGLARPEAVPLVLLALLVLELALLPVTNAVSRRYEAEADWIALEATRDPTAARRLARRLTEVSLADPDPPTWAYVLRRTHPTTMQRIAMAIAFEQAASGRPARASREGS